MRQNLTVALLTVCATLLLVLVVAQFTQPRPAVFGQTAGASAGNVVVATGTNQSGSDAVIYVYNAGSNKLAAYTTQNQGIKFLGVRKLDSDFKPDWLAVQGGKVYTPDDIEEAYNKSKGRK